MRKASAVIILLLTALFCFACCGQEEELVFHTVRFDVSYASASMEAPSDISVEDGKTVILPGIKAEATPGNVYIWTTDPIGKPRFDPSSSITEDLTFYAVEVPKRYKITYLFEFDGIVNSPKNPIDYDSTEEIVLQSPVVTTIPYGYKFIKWSYADDKESDVTRIPVGTKGDIVLRAYIIPATYKVEYADVNGEENPNAKSYLFGDELKLEPLDAEGFVCFTAKKDPTLVVEELTPAFITEHKDSLIQGGYIYLKAKWSDEQ